jgi:hypothetical protein
VNWFGLHLYWRRGNNLGSILLISPVADLYLSFRMQECRPPSPQDAGLILPSMGDGILISLRLSDPTKLNKRVRSVLDCSKYSKTLTLR